MKGSRGGGGWQQDTDEPCRRDGWEVGSRPLIMSRPRHPVCVPLTKIYNLVKISLLFPPQNFSKKKSCVIIKNVIARNKFDLLSFPLV